MQLRSAVLMGLDIWRVRDSIKQFRVVPSQPPQVNADQYGNFTPYVWTAIALGKKAPDSVFITYKRPDGYLARASAAYPIDVPPPEFWRRKVKRTYLCADEEAGHLTWRLTVDLRPETVAELLALSTIDRTKHISELFSLLIPKCEGEHVEVGNPYLLPYISILYLEPEQLPAVASLHTDTNGLIAFATGIQHVLGQSGSAPYPHIFGDVILFAGITVASLDTDVVAVGIKISRSAGDPDSDGLVLPDTVIDLGSCLRNISILRHASETVTALPFYKLHLSEYLAALTDSGTMASAYELRFLHDREHEMLECMKATHLANSVQEASKHNYVSLLDRLGESDGVETPASESIQGYRYDVLVSIKRRFSLALLELRSATELVQSKSANLSEYLRDRSIAEATRVNLRLQKSIKALTWAMAFLTLVAVIAAIYGVLPDNIRRLIHLK